MPLEIAVKDNVQRHIDLLRVSLAAMALVLSLRGLHRPGEIPWQVIAVYLAVASTILAMGFRNGRAAIHINPWFDLCAAAAALADPNFWGAACCLLFLGVYGLVATGKSRPALVATLLISWQRRATVWLTIRALMRFAPSWAFRFVFPNYDGSGSGVCLPLAAYGGWLLGRREHAQCAHDGLVDKIISGINFERGLSEAVHQTLADLALAFGCERACLMFQDEELERLYLWR